MLGLVSALQNKYGEKTSSTNTDGRQRATESERWWKEKAKRQKESGVGMRREGVSGFPRACDLMGCEGLLREEGGGGRRLRQAEGERTFTLALVGLQLFLYLNDVRE